MSKNIDRFKADLNKLIVKGNKLQESMDLNCFPVEMKAELQKQHGKKAPEYIKELPSFKHEYQSWYSEAIALVRQLLPDRLADFIRPRIQVRSATANGGLV